MTYSSMRLVPNSCLVRFKNSPEPLALFLSSIGIDTPCASPLRMGPRVHALVSSQAGATCCSSISLPPHSDRSHRNRQRTAKKILKSPFHSANGCRLETALPPVWRWKPTSHHPSCMGSCPSACVQKLLPALAGGPSRGFDLSLPFSWPTPSDEF